MYNIEYAGSALSYANQIAKYIKDPSTVQAHTKNAWGVTLPIKTCRELVEKHRLPTEEEKREKAALKAARGDFACGHPRSEANIYIYGTQQRCRTCNRERQRIASQRARDRKREALIG